MVTMTPSPSPGPRRTFFLAAKMKRLHRFPAWFIIGLCSAGCAEQSVREPSLDEVGGYIPGRVYNDDGPATAKNARPARQPEPTSVERVTWVDEPDEPLDPPAPAVANDPPPDPPGHEFAPIDPAPSIPPASETEVYEAHNRIRFAAKLPRLQPSQKLEAAARRHAEDMASSKAMTHSGSDGSTPFDRIKAAGYVYRRAGENVAVARFGVERLMKGWMDSPHHKANILGPFSQIGVAYATGSDGKRYWCVTFGLPMRR